MGAESNEQDLDLQIRTLVGRVVDHAPPAPDLWSDDLLIRRAHLPGCRRPPSRVLASLAAAAAIVAATVWTVSQRDDAAPIATASGVSVPLSVHRDPSGRIDSVLAGARQVPLTVSNMPGAHGEPAPLCFMAVVSSICVSAPPGKMSFGMVDSSEAGAVMVVLSPTQTARLVLYVDGRAFLQQHPVDGIAAWPATDLPDGRRTLPEEGMSLVAYDVDGRVLARSPVG